MKNLRKIQDSDMAIVIKKMRIQDMASGMERFQELTLFFSDFRFFKGSFANPNIEKGIVVINVVHTGVSKQSKQNLPCMTRLVYITNYEPNSHSRYGIFIVILFMTHTLLVE